MGRVRPRGRYPREFKIEVVRRIARGEKTLSEVCRELDLSPQYVSRWMKQLSDKGVDAFPGRSKGSKSSSELDALRREVERLKEENDILKKAAAYFARSVR